MPEPVRIDTHMHLYPTRAAGRRDKDTYEIWEYGSKPDVAFSRFDGDIEDAEAAMLQASYQHAVIANLAVGWPEIHRHTFCFCGLKVSLLARIIHDPPLT